MKWSKRKKRQTESGRSFPGVKTRETNTVATSSTGSGRENEKKGVSIFQWEKRTKVYATREKDDGGVSAV
jgi:hypothetical protein